MEGNREKKAKMGRGKVSGTADPWGDFGMDWLCSIAWVEVRGLGLYTPVLTNHWMKHLQLLGKQVLQS